MSTTILHPEASLLFNSYKQNINFWYYSEGYLALQGCSKMYTCINIDIDTSSLSIFIIYCIFVFQMLSRWMMVYLNVLQSVNKQTEYLMKYQSILLSYVSILIQHELNVKRLTLHTPTTAHTLQTIGLRGPIQNS